MSISEKQIMGNLRFASDMRQPIWWSTLGDWTLRAIVQPIGNVVDKIVLADSGGGTMTQGIPFGVSHWQSMSHVDWLFVYFCWILSTRS